LWATIVCPFLGGGTFMLQVKKCFISGIADNVKKVLTYLKQRGVVPTYMSMFASKGTLSAKIHIPSSSKHLVEKNYFWPKFVSCRPWKSNPEKANLTNPMGAHNGNYATDV
jgi:hypothetical protein